MFTDIKNQRLFSSLYFVCVAIGVISFWVTPHLPLIDYPQHVAQLALLKDLLADQSPWSGLVTINYHTPNLVVYLLGLLLSTVFSVTTSFKILISIGYITFIFACIQLRKHFKADPRLDWIFLIPFFGYAYKWGFITFVLSAPIALYFILLSDKYAKHPASRTTWGLLITGIILMHTHGLMFLFTYGLGGLLTIANAKNIKSSLIYLTPYLLLIVYFAFLFKLNSDFNNKLLLTNYTFSNGITFQWGLSFKRFLYAVPNTVGVSIRNFPEVIYVFNAVIIFLYPWALGLKPNLSSKSPLLFFSLVWVAILFIPNYVLGTYEIHQRFAIFLIPSYVLLFSLNNNQKNKLDNSPILKTKISTVLLIFTTFSSLTLHTYSNYLFKKETLDIDNMLAKLEPKQKIFFLILDSYSKSNHYKVYRHYPLWYQTNYGGFVEGNTVLGSFASMAPFPVRYKPGLVPEKVRDDLTKKIHISFEEFRYIIIRDKVNKPIEDLFLDYACYPDLIDSKGEWSIYDTHNCKGQ